MQTRVRHSLRFALATLAAVWALGVLWEVVDTYLLGDVADGMGRLATVAFNERIWRAIAAIEATVVFFYRLSDLQPTPPSWPFAFALASWLGVASIACGTAVEEGRWTLAIGLAITALVVWLVLGRRLPGHPRTRAAHVASRPAEGRNLR